MANIGYYRTPSINKNLLVFNCDDDLWRIDLQDKNPRAERLTFGPAINTWPLISPDGLNIAYISSDDKSWNINLLSSEGGEPERLTFHEYAYPVSWQDSKTLIIRSTQGHFTLRETPLFKLNIETKELSPINLGPATSYSENELGATLLGRNGSAPEKWKRYKGGTAANLWVRNKPDAKFKRILKNIQSHISYPTWINNRIYFISDYEGVGNIYSCRPNGQDLRRETHHQEYYARNLSGDGEKLTYTCGADLFVFDPSTKESKKVDFNIRISAAQARPRYIDAEMNLQEFEVNTDASKILLTSRGKLFVMPPWSKAPIQLGEDHARYKNAIFLEDSIFAFFQDEEKEESLVKFDPETGEQTFLQTEFDWGKSVEVKPDEKKGLIAIYNNRNEVFIYDAHKNKITIAEEQSSQRISGLNWSHDGRYLAYDKSLKSDNVAIFLYDIEKKTSRQLLTPVHQDFAPFFDPNGDYLYFLSVREFQPVYSELTHDYGFPKAIKPYAVCLRKDVESPLETHLDFEKSSDDDDDDEEKEVFFEIDFDQIEDRIIPLPLDIGGYESLSAIENKLFFIQNKIQTLNPDNGRSRYNGESSLFTFDLKTKKKELFQKDVGSYALSFNGKYIFMDTDEGLRLSSTDSKPNEEDEISRKDGWVDLERIKYQLDPRLEWRQMYQEAWVLQRDHFWDEKMSSIDWEDVYVKYLPLVDRITTRDELQDLLWEMQGELGTSHAYAFGGDYPRKCPVTKNGFLGVQLKFNHNDKSYEVISLFRGDSWIPGHSSPLLAPTVAMSEGDKILAVDGISFNEPNDIYECLIGKTNHKIHLEILRTGRRKTSHVVVETVSSELKICYRSWVANNRKYVNEKTNGKIGYLHIPDMSLHGVSEFYRHYYTEAKKEGLIIDVRYNGGGNASQFFLKELQQMCLGILTGRHYGLENYPKHSVNGPLVAITNEAAGSDGDIFSHSFKLLGLGKLIGKRTWGGVVGIWPRTPLNDHGLTSQPEFAHWFKDVGWGVENYGTDPDIEVEITPEDWRDNVDSQLDRAISEVMKNPGNRKTIKPNLNRRPNLKAPRLPKA